MLHTSSPKPVSQASTAQPFKLPAQWLTASALALGLMTTGVTTLAALGTVSPAQAQTSTAAAEPTLAQVYEAAQAGKLDQAQLMMQQVLVAHPNSAKAHFVQAELSAKQGQWGRAREALATAEKLAPGLGFAKADAVQALRTQLNAASATSNSGSNNAVATRTDNAKSMSAPAAPAAPASSFPWGLALALGGGAIGLAIYMNGKKTNAAAAANGGLNGNGQGMGAGGGIGSGIGAGVGSGLGGAQTFGNGQQPYGQPAYGQQPAPGMGMGGRVMGGLATGLAVGAGVMAAQAIGKSMMGNDEHGSHNHQNNANNGSGGNGFEPLNNNANPNFGGQNFGVSDAGSWDDGGGMGAVASNSGDGDWDS